jgi:hypothetical protein
VCKTRASRWCNDVFLFKTACLILTKQKPLQPKIIIMADFQQTNDILVPGEESKLPSGLNVLTILTFIGSAIGLLGTVWNFINAKKGLEQMEATINSPEYENMPALAKKFMNPEALELVRKSYENRVPITVIGLIAIALCVVGAVQMRKRKAQGYVLYTIGELLPIVSSVIFLGAASLAGFGGIITIAISVLFVLLYTAQRKYLINK